MPLPVIGWVLITAIVSLGGGFALYQIKGTVTKVTEVFTSKESALNNVVFQAIIGAGVVFALRKVFK